MKKQGILNRDLSAVFAKLGHTDQITIADCGLPIPQDIECIDLSFRIGQPSFMDIMEAVLEDLEVECAFIADEMMHSNPAIHESVTGKITSVTEVPHEQFKTMTRNSKVIIRTGEATPFANIILQSGVIF